MAKILPSETILEDSANVFWDYVYIADNKIIRSNIQGTVKDLKRDLKAKEIRRCDIFHEERKTTHVGDVLETE